MCASGCNDRLRFRLNDDGGVLRFVEFDILNPLTCQDMVDTLRRYLVGRALADVDLAHLRKLKCTGNGECMRAVLHEVEKQQHLFIGKNASGSAIRKRAGLEAHPVAPCVAFGAVISVSAVRTPVGEKLVVN